MKLVWVGEMPEGDAEMIRDYLEFANKHRHHFDSCGCCGGATMAPFPHKKRLDLDRVDGGFDFEGWEPDGK